MLRTDEILLSSQQEYFLLLVHCALWQAGQNTLGYTYILKQATGGHIPKRLEKRLAFTFQQPKYLFT